MLDGWMREMRMLRREEERVSFATACFLAFLQLVLLIFLRLVGLVVSVRRERKRDGGKGEELEEKEVC